MPANETHIVEVFSSFQGEGSLVGDRQLFIRFAECNLHCRYCDTVYAREKPANCLVEQTAGRGDMRPEPNPVTVQRLVDIVASFDAPPHLHHYIALTGGEPLLHSDFLERFLTANKVNAIGVLLETNGTLPDRLKDIIECVHLVSMDIKLQSVTGEETPWNTHKRFLDVAGPKAQWVKVVVSEKTTEQEVARAAALIASAGTPTEMILQPVTRPDGTSFADARKLAAFHEAARAHLEAVRVIPQMHKILKLK
jgi:organic radical activating enzyme